MSTRAPGAANPHEPRVAAALFASLWLLGCSGSEASSDEATGGSAPITGGAVGASGSGGAPSSGGKSATGGAATGGAAAGGAATGGSAPSGGSAGSGEALGGAGVAGGSSGSSGASSLGGGGGRSGGGSGGLAPSGGRAPNGGGGSGGASSTGGTTNAGSAGASAGGPSGGSGGSGSSCPLKGSVTYTLMRAASPTAAQTAAYDKITAALDKAVGYYNCYTDITKELRASYEPSVATADGNVNGSIRFGSQDSMNYITAMHEIGHTVGVGSNEWGRMIRDGIFTGETATQKLREIDDDPAAQVHGDAQHFWPYGLNYTNEVKSDADLLAHCAMVMAIRADIYP